jgi:hypothetical protein
MGLGRTGTHLGGLNEFDDACDERCLCSEHAQQPLN